MGVSNFGTIKANLGASYRALNHSKYVFSQFSGPVVGRLWVVGSTGNIDGGILVPGVASLDINDIRVGNRNWHLGVLGAFAGTAPQVRMTPQGLSVQLDAVDNDGYEFAPSLGEAITFAATGLATDLTYQAPARAIDTFKARTDDCFVRVKLILQDVSAQDTVAVGFRRSEKTQATGIGTFTDYYVVNVNVGTAESRTRLNSGTEAVVASTETVADAGTVTLEVRVNTGGVARGFVNDAALATSSAAYTFDLDDLLIPTLYVQNSTVDGGAVHIVEWESGPWDQRGLAGILDVVN